MSAELSLNQTLHIGLCEGRHEITTNEGEPLHGYIFGQVENPLDFANHEEVVEAWFNATNMFEGCTLHLYVTGLTPLLTSFLNFYHRTDGAVKLVLNHFNRDTSSYEGQPMFSE